MELFKNKWILAGLMALVVAITLYRSLMATSLTDRPGIGYDEQMWTSSSIASYNMYFKGLERNPKQLDNWFATYAWRNDVDVFTGEKYDQFLPDTVKFPYDYITPVKGGYSSLIKFDTLKFPRSEYQWFDKDLWTFGWKAPNVGKYIMGWWIHAFSDTPPNPQGYFVYYQPVHELDTSRKDFTPSTKPSAAPFSYAPVEFVGLARVPNALANTLCIALVMVVGWFAISYWAGLTAGVWLAFNTTFLNVNSAVGLDSFSALFSILAILLLIKSIEAIIKQAAWGKALGWAAATGAAIALAMSSKLNAGILVYVVVACYGITLVGCWLKSRKTEGKKDVQPQFKTYFIKLVGTGVLMGSITAVLFLGLNPQLTPQPTKRIKAMRESIDEYFTKRAAIFTQNERKKDPRTATNWTKLKDDFGLSLNLMLERVAYVQNPQKNYYGTLGSLLKFKGNVLDGLLAIVGLAACFLAAWQAWKKSKDVTGALVVLIGFLFTFIANTDFLWQDWSRYFTPVFPLYSLLVGLGTVTLAQWLYKKIKKPA